MFWTLALGALVMSSCVALFYYPGLQLPDQEQFQLFTLEHVFERYDQVRQAAAILFKCHNEL